MQVYVVLVESVDEELEQCKVFYDKRKASEFLQDWADDNGIILDKDETESDLYFEEEDGEEEYISQVIDDGVGKIRIIPSELVD